MTKPKRRTRGEIRELVVGAALELVRTHGLGVEPKTISYQRVFDHLEETSGVRITRASVHERLWASQEDFQVEVLLRVSRMEAGLGAAAEAAARTLESSESTDTLTRMREVAHSAPNAVLRISTDDPLFYSWVGFTLSLAKDSATHPQTRAELAARTKDEYLETDERGAELLHSLSHAIGVRPRTDLFSDPSEGYLLISRLGLAMAEGVTVRMRFDKGELPDIELMTGPNGEVQTWTAFAAGYWALLNTFLEEDPEARGETAEEP